jgi:hypothetical protein
VQMTSQLQYINCQYASSNRIASPCCMHTALQELTGSAGDLSSAADPLPLF